MSCEGVSLKNYCEFKYLGSMFTADIRRRVSLTADRYSSCWDIKLSVKLKIYKCSVDSLFAYWSEA